MAEMPPLFYSSLDVILPHNPMGYVAPKNFCGHFQQWLPDPNIMFILIDHNNWYHIVFWMGKAMVDRNSLQQIVHSSCVYKARCATGYLGILAQSAWNG